MEINITDFFKNEEPFHYSASNSEMGGNAGPATWEAANEAATLWNFIDTPEAIEEFKQWVEEFGAWDKEEIDAWTHDERNALLIQYISGDIREAGLDEDSTLEEWEEYNANDSVSHNLFRTDDGDIYFSVN